MSRRCFPSRKKPRSAGQNAPAAGARLGARRLGDVELRRCVIPGRRAEREVPVDEQVELELAILVVRIAIRGEPKSLVMSGFNSAMTSEFWAYRIRALLRGEPVES